MVDPKEAEDTAASRRERLTLRIARVNEVSAMARTSWITLLAYLGFVGVTLLGVEDADFFMPSRQTQLPLVNVSIPTESFFVFAPILGAALYVYLHIVLLKLWDAIADIDEPVVDGQPLGEWFNPWLLNDWALTRRDGNFTPPRPLRALGIWASFFLVWAAAPAVLFFFWIWSMPAHKPPLTLTLAACFLIALHVGATSWQTANAWLSGDRTEPRKGLTLQSIGAFLSAFRTRHAARARLAELADATRNRAWGHRDLWYLGAFLVCMTLLATAWPLEVGRFSTLARADLANVEMVDLPAGWRSWDTARLEFRETWCARQGLDMSVCGPPRDRAASPDEWLLHGREGWCDVAGIGKGQPCKDAFALLDSRFADAWRVERLSAIADLPRLDLANADLRRANARNVTLVGVDLRGARLEGADFSRAQLEGAKLTGAQSDGADFSEAWLEGAEMQNAQLARATMYRARLDEADLTDANLVHVVLSAAILSDAVMELTQLDDAELDGAYLVGTNLYTADLAGANLAGAVLVETNLYGAILEGAVLSGAYLRRTLLLLAEDGSYLVDGADLRDNLISKAQGKLLVGNSGTLLPASSSNLAPSALVLSCWEQPPPGWEDIEARLAGPSWGAMQQSRLEEVRATFLCKKNQNAHPVGTPCPLELPRERCRDWMQRKARELIARD
jgi:uncharacterized protein YjbI with pentapeptide repeats